MNRPFQILGLLLAMGAAAFSGCSLIDEDLSDCGEELTVDYQLRLVTNMRTELETDLTISVNPPETMAADTRAAVARGFTILKVKVGKGGAEDVKRVRAVRQAAGENTVLRIDANQGWKDKKQALEMIHWLAEHGVVMVEQPMPKEALDDNAWITENSPLPVFADEAILSSMWGYSRACNLRIHSHEDLHRQRPSEPLCA